MGGIQLLLIALPDGSRTLVPEQWTNWNPNETDCTLASGDEGRERCIAPLADLLHLRTIVDALLDRESTSRPEPVIDEEGNHATESGAAAPAASIKPAEVTMETREAAVGILARILAQTAEVNQPTTEASDE
jgi:hypothetical protein